MKMKYFSLRLTSEHKKIKKDIKYIDEVIVAGFEKHNTDNEHAHLILHTPRCEQTIRKLVQKLGYTGNESYMLTAPYTEVEMEDKGLKPAMRYTCKGVARGDYDVTILDPFKALTYNNEYWDENARRQNSKRAENKRKTTSIIKLVTDYVEQNKREFIDNQGVILDEKLTGYIIKKYIEYRKPHNVFNVESLFNVCMGILNPNEEINYIMQQMKFYNNGGKGSCSTDTSNIDLTIKDFSHKREKVQDKVNNYFSSSNLLDDLENKCKEDFSMIEKFI